MTRDAALETAYRLAAGSGIAYNVYHSRRTRSGWQIIDGYRVNKDSFYTVNPDRSATFRLGIGCKAARSTGAGAARQDHEEQPASLCSASSNVQPTCHCASAPSQEALSRPPEQPRH